jgi:hypothetical protein
MFLTSHLAVILASLGIYFAFSFIKWRLSLFFSQIQKLHATTLTVVVLLISYFVAVPMAIKFIFFLLFYLTCLVAFSLKQNNVYAECIGHIYHVVP